MKLRRILALAGAVLLFAMYACTLIFALTDHSAAQGLLKASIACTIILPVLLYGYTLTYRVTRNFYENTDIVENKGADTADNTDDVKQADSNM